MADDMPIDTPNRIETQRHRVFGVSLHVVVRQLNGDNPSLAELRDALQACEGAEFRIEVASNDEEFECLLEERGAVDVVVLDLDPADPVAVEAATKLFGRSAYVPIMLLVDDAKEAEAWRVCAMGAQGVLPRKPSSPEVLAWRIKQTIEQFVTRDTLGRRLHELELANGRFLSLVVDNADAIVVVDRAGVVRFVNPSAERLLRCSASELLGEMFGIPIEGVDITEVDLPRRLGSKATAEIRVMRTLWDGERAFIVTMRDVTDRKKAERALLIAKQSAEQASEMKSQFLTNMSHELRTPLNAIIGFSELMLLEGVRPIEPPKYRGYVQDIHNAGKHLLALISDLLDLSKAEKGNTELYESKFNIVALADEVVDMLRGDAALKGLRLHRASDPPSVWVNADERLIKQVMLNLLSNALKFTPKGGDVNIFVRQTASGGVTVRVSDSGEGIPKEMIPRAFAAFVQLKPGYARSESAGTGLGLALTKRFVEIHGGEISIESEVGVGTTVAFTLPASRAVAAGRRGGKVVSITDRDREDRQRNADAIDC